MREEVRGLRMLTGPVVEPVTLALAKQHLRIEADVTRDDDYVSMLIRVGRSWVEEFTRRALMEQTWRLTLDRFSGNNGYRIDLVKPPIASVTAISYQDENGDDVIIDPATYKVDIQDAYARIAPVFGEQWPIPNFGIATIQIDHLSGYSGIDGDPDNAVPAPLKQAILLWVGHLYETRQPVTVGTIATQTPLGIEDLCSMYRVLRFAA